MHPKVGMLKFAASGQKMNKSRKVAVVTGAAGGIGFASAQQLGADGFAVWLIDVQKEMLEKSVLDLRSQNIAASGLVINLAQEAEIASIPERMGSDYTDVAVLVNNAAISPKTNGLKLDTREISLDEWEAVLKVNITAPFRLSQIFLKPMIERGWGRIINISSKGGRTPGGIAGAHYVTSKTGILGLTRSLAKDFAQNGITVNAIAPGRVETPMTMQSSPEIRASMGKTIPVGRLGQPVEVGALVRFLAGDHSGFITGATLDINGGAVMI